MYPVVWDRVMRRTHPSQAATVRGYCRRRIENEVYPAMVPGGVEDEVAGVLYSDLSTTELATLDQFEHEGVDYRRIEVPALLADGGMLTAFSYIYAHPDRLEGAWDHAQFEREGLQRFLDTYFR
jgi:gamma-glutamylcyclotransferase (GGCT)/AIG2-like uncharacterized protein YtfP